MPKLRCPKCGFVFEGELDRCPRCGVAFKKPGAPEVPHHPVAQQAAQQVAHQPAAGCPIIIQQIPAQPPVVYQYPNEPQPKKFRTGNSKRQVVVAVFEFIFSAIFITAMIVNFVLWYHKSSGDPMTYLLFSGFATAGIYLAFGFVSRAVANRIMRYQKLRRCPFHSVSTTLWTLLNVLNTVFYLALSLGCVVFVTAIQLIMPNFLFALIGFGAGAAIPILYHLNNLLINYFCERDNLFIQQAQDVEDIKILNQKK